MSTFVSSIKAHTSVSKHTEVRANRPLAGDMSNDHKEFVQNIATILESGAIDVSDPSTMLNQDIYVTLDETEKAKVDQAMVNMSILLRHIYDFFKSKQTPDACPQLEQMIEHLWQMKERIEAHADVFKF